MKWNDMFNFVIMLCTFGMLIISMIALFLTI